MVLLRSARAIQLHRLQSFAWMIYYIWCFPSPSDSRQPTPARAKLGRSSLFIAVWPMEISSVSIANMYNSRNIALDLRLSFYDASISHKLIKMLLSPWTSRGYEDGSCIRTRGDHRNPHNSLLFIYRNLVNKTRKACDTIFRIFCFVALSTIWNTWCMAE